MNLKSIRDIDVFHPYILIVIVLLFLAIAMPTWYYSGEIPPPYPQLYGYIALGLIFFVFGILFSRFVFKRFALNKISDLDNEDKFKLKGNRNLEKLPFFGNYSKKELILIAVVFIGILLQVINIAYLGGIPLFSASLKSRAATKIWLLSYIIFLPGINILLAKFNRNSHFILLIMGLILFALTGYRTTPITILLSVFITLFYTRDFKLKYQIIFVLMILIALVSIGFIAVKAISWQNWNLGPLQLVSYRAAFTLRILDRAINRQFMTGGALFYSTLTGFFTSTDPRVLVGQAVLSRNHSITSTIFGPALLDFGFIGMSIQMFLIGFILKTLHFIKEFKSTWICGIYGIILAQTLIWIETGPTDFVVWIFYFIAILIIISTFHKIFKSNLK